MVQEKYLVVKSSAGLGNRILNALGSILYAKITQRTLVIDWSDDTYSQDGSNIFPKLFHLLDVKQDVVVPKTDSVYPVVWKGNLDKSVYGMLKVYDIIDKPRIFRHPLLWSKYRVDTRYINYPDQCLVSWYYAAEIDKLRRHFKGEFARLRRMSNSAIQKEIVRKHLQPSDLVQHRVEAFRKIHLPTKSIGVHIRYTDRKNSYAKYPIIIDQLLDKDPDLGIFLATDNQQVEKYFKERYGAIVVCTEKWFPSKQVSIHENKECPDKFEATVQALTDMYLLASCDYLICDQTSTFAIVAELISDIPKSNVFDMSRFSLKRNIENTISFLDRYW